VWEGDVLNGKYRVERVIGVGGMGVVVAAMHLQLEQRVALKFMLPEVLNSRVAVERFPREARAAARLKSEHVARIIDVDALASGAPYIVMEYLDGIDLAAVLKQEGALPVRVIADYVTQALDAIAEAHALGIVHRDLKPGNLFITRRSDGGAWVKVLDFGISKVDAAASDLSLTRTQAIIGSPKYMSPEQLRASKLVDARSDIWSLGIILYELATGGVPFTSDVFSEMVIKVAMDPTPPMVAPQPLPGGFEALVRRCLEKDPTGRFQSVAELATALAPFAPVSSRPIVQRIRNLLGGEAPRVTEPVEMLERPLAPTVTAAGQVAAGTRRRARWPRGIGRAVAVLIAASALVGIAVGLLQTGDDDATRAPAETPAAQSPSGVAPFRPAQPALPASAAPSSPSTDASPPVERPRAPATAATEATAPSGTDAVEKRARRRDATHRERSAKRRRPPPAHDDPLATPE